MDNCTTVIIADNAEEFCGSLAAALQRAEDAMCAGGAVETASDGDTVLLSPACTSFDAFRNFAERGEVFREMVKAL